MRRICVAVMVAEACASARGRPRTLAVVEPLEHPAETRGFLSVPVDWDHPAESGNIRVFYRLIGKDPAKPLLVFFNGGPGLPASNYVALDRSANALEAFESEFRLLLIDPRGTGLSSPLDVDAPRFDPDLVVRLYGSAQHARDAAAVISHVAPHDEPFFILAHSAGGQIALHFLALQGARRPAAVVLAAPAMPYLDPVRVFLARRMSQHRLNEEILGPRPELQAKVLRLRERIGAEHYVDLDGTPLVPQMVSAYFRYLNRLPETPARTAQWLDRLLQAPIVEVNKDLRAKMANPHNMLTQVLAVPDLFGDSIPDLVARTNPLVEPFSSWMFDEGELYAAVPSLRGGKYRALLDGLPALVRWRVTPPLGAVEDALHQIRLLCVVAEDDAQFGVDSQKEQFAMIADPSKSRLIVLPAGGHGAVFSKDGASLVKGWLNQRRPE